MMLEIAGAIVLLGIGYAGAWIQCAVGVAASSRALAGELRFCANGVTKYPERVVQILNSLADAAEGK